MEGILITSVLSSIGLGLSSFFGVFLLRNNKLENRLLAWLLIALSLRITKSIFYIHLELPLIIKNIGLAANLAVGPLLFLYVSSFLQKKKQLKTEEAAHFIPSLLYLLLSPILPNGGDSSFWMISYSFILIQSFIYVFLSASLLAEKIQKPRSTETQWLIALITSLTVMWLVYALIFLSIIPVYFLGPLTFSISIFVLLYVALNHYPIFLGRKKSKSVNTRINDEAGRRYFAQLKSLLDSEQLYTHADLSLSFLAKKMNLLERDISYIVNHYGDCNFAQFINAYRIEEAKRLIEEDSTKKLIAIAFEAGFNNLSTFNKAFKVSTGLTPSQFRKK
ncbi:MAG: helix-turn-helix domain-containing protein [Bacteroidia bacterium]|nr:helix-turn-helix domain-containing protein [Bacteroidia bacterium]